MGGGGDGFNRSMSYHGNSSSPPLSGGGDSGLKIGTWNEPRQEGSGQGMGSGTGQFPAVSNFEIGTFNMTDPGSRQNGYGNGNNGGGPTTQSNNGPIQPGMGIRETGIIEKLLHSYGFIQCCDRQARLFFHFSQFDGNIEHLKIGDPVEFEMTYDRRTGKPIASAVSKIAPEVVIITAGAVCVHGQPLNRSSTAHTSSTRSATASGALLDIIVVLAREGEYTMCWRLSGSPCH